MWMKIIDSLRCSPDGAIVCCSHCMVPVVSIPYTITEVKNGSILPFWVASITNVNWFFPAVLHKNQSSTFHVILFTERRLDTASYNLHVLFNSQSSGVSWLACCPLKALEQMFYKPCASTTSVQWMHLNGN